MKLGVLHPATAVRETTPASRRLQITSVGNVDLLSLPTMPSIKWNIILSAPFAVLKVMIVGTLRSTIVLLARITLPFRLRKLTLRNGLYRAWIRTIFQFNPALFCSEPRKHGCQEVALQPTSGTSKSEVVGYIVPSTLVHNLKDKDAIIVYAHGGGYAFGHALQNLTMFHRLTRKAKALGQDIAFATVKYRESAVQKRQSQDYGSIHTHACSSIQHFPQ